MPGVVCGTAYAGEPAAFQMVWSSAKAGGKVGVMKMPLSNLTDLGVLTGVRGCSRAFLLFTQTAVSYPCNACSVGGSGPQDLLWYIGCRWLPVHVKSCPLIRLQTTPHTTSGSRSCVTLKSPVESNCFVSKGQALEGVSRGTAGVRVCGSGSQLQLTRIVDLFIQYLALVHTEIEFWGCLVD